MRRDLKVFSPPTPPATSPSRSLSRRSRACSSPCCRRFSVVQSLEKLVPPAATTPTKQSTKDIVLMFLMTPFPLSFGRLPALLLVS